MCNVVDYAWSNTWLLRITGNAVYGDRVERDVFNAGPGGIAPDFKSHVYYLSPNRIDATHPAKPGAGGLTSYAPKQQPLCCTGNLSRLLPNYVGSMWMASADGGFAATLYGPCIASVSVDGTKIRLETQTDYPFGSDITVKIAADQPREFPLYLRLPSWCQKPLLTINGEPREIRDTNGFALLKQTWKTGDIIRLSLPMEGRVASGRCADGAPYTSVTYGPLLFALPIPILNNDLNTPDTTFPFQYALQPGSAIKVAHHPMPLPWSWDKAPLQLTIKSEAVTFGANFALPKQPVAATGEPLTELTLRPFGATAFRISMFALAKPETTK
ncbi:MAG: beta-L-arabinofuranosidase domain-containing protein [Chthoniobacteraceae bacterium]